MKWTALLYPEAITPTQAFHVELGKTPSVECIFIDIMQCLNFYKMWGCSQLNYWLYRVTVYSVVDIGYIIRFNEV